MNRYGPDRATRSRSRRQAMRRIRRLQHHHRKENTVVNAEGKSFPQGFVVKHCGAEGCGAPIIWAVSTSTRRAAPLDAYPSEDGNCRLMAGEPATYEVLGAPELRAPHVGSLHTNHFKTCEYREDFRRTDRRRKKAGQ